MGKDSFKDMFSRGEIVVIKHRRVSVGEEVEGVVGHIGKDAVLVDLDDKQQAYFELPDLCDIHGKPLVKPGDRVRGFVVSTEGAIHLAKRFGRASSKGGEVSADHLALAQQEGTPVEGKITGVNKGGVEVEMAGVRAFCPASQLDDHFVADTSGYIGRTLTFLVTKVDGRNVVVSRRALLGREAMQARAQTLASIVIGSVMKGRVSQLREFGAFVDLGGVEGLIPLRELSHDRVKAGDVVSIGDVVEVQVKSIEQKGDKTEITLSLKALAADPWSAIEAVAPVGRVVAGQVTRLADFGAFVRIASGVEGLLHVWGLGARVKHASEALEIGQSILTRVVSVDPIKKRIGLAPAAEGATAGSEDRGPAIVIGRIVSAKVEKVENFGLVVQIDGAAGRAGRAVIPSAETGTRPGADLRREFPAGTVVSAKVIEAGEAGGRRGPRLSIRAAVDDAERADFDTYRAGTRDQARMGTLGDMLKRKLGG